MSRGMWMLFTLIGFAMGGIMYGRILPEKLANKDVCALSPDHNPGAANVFTYCGWKMGLLCLALDLGKGFFPVFIACRLSGGDFTNPMIAPLMLAPVLGHALAPFSRKKGGKAIACAFGVLLGLPPFSAWLFCIFCFPPWSKSIPTGDGASSPFPFSVPSPWSAVFSKPASRWDWAVCSFPRLWSSSICPALNSSRSRSRKSCTPRCRRCN